jgi:pyruvate kinase
VQSTIPSEVVCTVTVGGRLAEHQGINLPGVAVSAPALTEKDRSDLAFGVERDVDYVALSFVRRSEDVVEAKNLIKELADGQYPIPVIAKLEKPEAISNLEAILHVADGVMVARGDLGVEMPLEDVPLVQKRIIQRANVAGLPVITATQMLESMIHSPRPTRAEASDVANAILDGTDALMLSGETAVGEYPEETVKVMSRIAEATEVDYQSRDVHPPRTLPHAVSAAAHTLADQAEAELVVVFTRSGLSAQLISKERPRAPIVAYTPLERVHRSLALWWGVTPRQSEVAGSTEKLIRWVDQELQTEGVVAPGARVVIMGGMPVAERARTNFIKLHQVGEA